MDREARQNPHVIIIFIILGRDNDRTSESSISFSARLGFQLDILHARPHA